MSIKEKLYKERCETVATVTLVVCGFYILLALVLDLINYPSSETTTIELIATFMLLAGIVFFLFCFLFLLSIALLVKYRTRREQKKKGSPTKTVVGPAWLLKSVMPVFIVLLLACTLILYLMHRY